MSSHGIRDRVAIIGMGCTPFGEHWDKGPEDLLVDAAQDQALDAALSQSTVAQQEIFDSDDLHEGAAAFFAKRPPEFGGR